MKTMMMKKKIVEPNNDNKKKKSITYIHCAHTHKHTRRIHRFCRPKDPMKQPNFFFFFLILFM